MCSDNLNIPLNFHLHIFTSTIITPQIVRDITSFMTTERVKMLMEQNKNYRYRGEWLYKYIDAIVCMCVFVLVTLMAIPLSIYHGINEKH